MTDQTAAVYRPSPRPRPGSAPSRPAEATPKLRIVPTVEETQELPSSEPQQGPLAPQITAGQSGSTAETADVSSESGFRLRITAGWSTIVARCAATSAYWTPPAVFTDRPASLQDLADYAYRAPWTTQPHVAKPHTDEHTKKLVTTGLARRSGIWWYRIVGYPQTVRYRYSEWVWQRPGRVLVVGGVIKLVSMTGPGDWAVHTVIYPAAQFAGHIFL